MSCKQLLKTCRGMMAGHRSLCLRVPGKPCWRSQRSQTFIPLALAYPLGCSSNADTPTMASAPRGSSRRCQRSRMEVQQMCFPCSSSKQAKADTVEHANQVDRLALSGPNGVCKHASMQHQTSCQRLGSSSGYRQQRQHFVFHAKQMWKPSGSPKSSVVQTTNPF